MFWFCPGLSTFWTEVFCTLSQIVNVKLEPDPLAALFGFTGERVNLTVEKHRALSFASLLARQAILLKWKDAAPAHSYTMVSRHYVLFKVGENQIYSSAFQRKVL